ncbi:MAG TPA: MaoC/PaaZ C-terminal domain-containing protein, partial [Novosphingobium sp.]|nr:MaoC/PaaZ C-terminal domain-containing protein [Novosphingobium sp.]
MTLLSADSPEAATPMIENRTYEEISVGDSASLTRTLTHQDIELFALVSGDVNPAHMDPAYAATDMFRKVIAHGLWGAGLISAVLGTHLPGPGTIYLGQTLKFLRPVGLGDTITASVRVADKREKGRLTLACSCANQQGETVIEGEADVIAPQEKLRRPAVSLPEIRLAEHDAYRRLVHAAAGRA